VETGFRSVTGELLRMDIRGERGRSLKEHWSDGPRTDLGVQFSGFPNLWAIMGPHNPAVFCNIPRCAETNVEWIVDCMQYMREHGFDTMCTTAEAEDAWTRRCYDSAKGLLTDKMQDSWFFGSTNPRTCAADSCCSPAGSRSIERSSRTLLRADTKASSCARLIRTDAGNLFTPAPGKSAPTLSSPAYRRIRSRSAMRLK
jgi:hypothetical protein